MNDINPDDVVAVNSEKINVQEAETFIDIQDELVTSKTSKQKMMAVAFYWLTSLSLTFLNKLVMVGDIINLDAPLFMSWTQFLFTVIYCVILGQIGKFIKCLSLFPSFEYKVKNVLCCNLNTSI